MRAFWSATHDETDEKKLIRNLAGERLDYARAARAARSNLTFLRAILTQAHEDLDREPRRARLLTSIAIRAVRLITPRNSSVPAQALAGIAWKERGNALRATGRIRRAGIAAEYALTRLGGSDALIVEHASALILKAQIEQDLGHDKTAIQLLELAGATFQQNREHRRYLQTIMLRGIIEYEAKDYPRARATFDAALTAAERLGDDREAARLRNNLGFCALHLRDLVTAWDNFLAAVTGFRALGMTAEIPRAEWGLARLLRDHSTTQELVADLRRVCAEFTQRHMPVEAATVLLEIAAIFVGERKFTELRMVCAELHEHVAHADMPLLARNALARVSTDGPLDVLAADVADARNLLRHIGRDPQPHIPGH
ncbi:MAG TPA: hypothetical protein VGJ81_22910 [Thermoanaerobaculia bacterium]|jgi:tetratricopeptide (TPR) repeat protein